MVQVSKRSWSGRIKYCHVHDILRALAIRKAKEDNFLVVCTNSTAEASPRTQRLALLVNEFRFSELVVKSFAPNLRSFVYFGHDAGVPNYNGLRMVRVLHTETNKFDKKGVSWKHLTNLRYIRSAISVYSVFPVIANKVPSSFWNNKILRYVDVTMLIVFGSIHSIMGPPSGANLENLVSLKDVEARAEWAAKLPHFPLLRKLGVQIVAGTDWEALSSSLSELENLHSLRVFTSKGVQLSHPFFTPAVKSYRQLHSLFLHCCWPGHAVPDCSPFPPNLVKLTLAHCHFEQDPMPDLEKLPSLRVLRLWRYSYLGEQLVCSAGGFRCLQQLHLLGLLELKELEIEDGAMPVLTLLQIEECLKAPMLPDLQYLANLRELKITSMPQDLCSRLQVEGADHHKIRHVPSIIIENPKLSTPGAS